MLFRVPLKNYVGIPVTDIATLKAKLLARQSELSDVVNQYVADHEGRQTIDSFKEVSDVGERSVDDFQRDMDVAVVTQEVNELRTINAALKRMDSGDYGICVECGTEIAPERLDINPAVERCIDCQTRYEREHGTNENNPTL
jgi:DnaK suppressor protein